MVGKDINALEILWREAQEKDFERTEVIPPNTINKLPVTTIHATLHLPTELLLFLSLQHRKFKMHGRILLQEVLYPQPTVYDFFWTACPFTRIF